MPKAKEIIDKYKEDPDLFEIGRLLPMYGDPMINRTLKDIVKACGIREKMTFHVARYTFATAITLSNGMPNETPYFAKGQPITKLLLTYLGPHGSENTLTLLDKQYLIK